MNRLQELLIIEGSRIIGMLVRNKDLFHRAEVVESKMEEAPSSPELMEYEREEETTSSPGPVSEKSTKIATGCVPCSIGHLGTCSGLLNEAMRFARDKGIADEEVLGRVNMCLDELNSLERVDLRPEMINGLPEWEKSLAEKSLNLSRQLRHQLEDISSVPQLESIAGHTQTTRQEIGTTWMKERLSRMNPEQREVVEEKLLARAAEKAKQG